MAFLNGLEFFISKKVGKAVTDHHMLEDGDTVVVAVSGGKDSLTLLKVLNDRRKFVPIKYNLVAAHIDFGYHKPITKKLISYFKKEKIKYEVVKSDVLKKTDPKKINCFWCSWNRRKLLFELADRLNIKKVAFGHHKDDIVQTTLMNLFFHGEVSTMCPKQELFKGKIVIIRPMAYVEESMIKRFFKHADFPETQGCSCVHSDLSNRKKVAKIIQSLEKKCPEIRTNIFRATSRIKEGYLGKNDY